MKKFKTLKNPMDFAVKIMKENNSIVDVWKTTQEKMDVEFSISEQKLDEMLTAQWEGE
mgnify:CR=1 FL=1